MPRMVLAVIGCTALAAMAWPARSDDPKPKADRFDHEVREDLFAGFNGDAERLTRGMKTCDEALQKNPKHAEALVWRGAGRVFQAGQEFQKKNGAAGLKLWTSGLKDMDDAVALDPKNAGVRIPRAAVLMPAAQNAPAAMAEPLLAKALDDFETIYAMQKKDLDKIGTHPRGELRMGMADVYRRMGKLDKSAEQLDAVVKEMPDSKYATRAKEWKAAKAETKLAHTCIGCHTP